ncbi:porin [Magnetospira sp. QH-2]|uniref:porin n=1 Tax=Magnetospira sp. (strain QH-2) TaxID=1288970 RepID=UPI0003E8183F|nr:porin [Magnetospira sp. QH-2]CCQ75602.1 putative Outer membrane protein(Porin) [Magnetospira sp. QH-2]
MKKVLLTTTALVVAGAFASQAQAADPIKLSVGGHMNQWIMFADSDKATQTGGVDTLSDTEVYFKGDTTLENGLKVSVVIQLEGEEDTATNNADEQYVVISSDSLGTLRVGDKETALATIKIGSPAVGYGGPTDADDVVAPAFAGASDQFANAEFVDDDDNQVTYLSPSFAGFQVGGSWVPHFAAGDAQGGPNTNPVGGNNDGGWGVGAIYSADYDGIGVGVSGGYAYHDAGADIWQAGAKVSFAGFTVSGGWQRTDVHEVQLGNTNNALSVDGVEGTGWEAGVSYATGPYAVSLVYGAGEDEDTYADTDKDELKVWAVGANYSMGAGVMMKGTIYHADYNGETNTTGVGGDTASGWGGIVGMAISF